MNQTWWNLLSTLAIIMGVCVVVALIGLFALVRQIRQLRIPRDADFFTTMRSIPLPLVVLLDLLDFGLDIFSAPIMWVVLDRMGLPNLRNKAVIEALIPLTNIIPTFTVSWIAARLLNLGEQHWSYAERYREFADTREPHSSRRPRIIDMDDPRR